MIIRERYERKLTELQTGILRMGSVVEEQFTIAMRAFETLDTALAHEVQISDKQVNRMRFEIEDACFTLIVTQQPAARDLRLILAAMNMIVDLERMGDQAKGIAKVVPHVVKNPDQPRPRQLKPMGRMVLTMLNQALLAYAQNNVQLAEMVASQDDEVDRLYGEILSQIMQQMAQGGDPSAVEARYEMLRVAREVERFGDLATNIAERVIYLVTGSMQEYNVDHNDAVEEPRDGLTAT